MNRKVLVIQGSGMDRRGETMTDIFGPETLDEINERIWREANEIGIVVEILQSNDEAEICSKLRQLNDSEFGAVLINPGGFTVSSGELPATLAALTVPVYEVHSSNPTARGIASTVLPVSRGGICGFGYAGYGMVLSAIKVEMEAH